MQNFESLRKKYPKFIYEKYSLNLEGPDLRISFDFKIEPDFEFHPEITINNIDLRRFEELKEVIENLVFNLGIIEGLSYWKATCSPLIEVRAGSLSKDQIDWWEKIILKGMGQYFFENQVDFQEKDFLKIKAGEGKIKSKNLNLNSQILVPMGGGKDSATTLELLQKLKYRLRCFSLNPTNPAEEIIKLNNIPDPVFAKRMIDPKLLELNRNGFLNGHTPFSAYIAFLTVLVAVIFDYKFIAASNERSSNEGNVEYLGEMINHQWSKSIEFENEFRKYSKKYLVKDVEYFSFLRPLYEVQIAKIFSRYPKYFQKFISCNDAFKTNSGLKVPQNFWCNRCPKCLFAYIILYPFLETRQLQEIFRKDLFEDSNLISLLDQLAGEKDFKPFECVGTKKEVLSALYLGLGKNRQNQPLLLKHFKENILPKYKNLKKDSQKMLKSWNKENNLPKKDFKKILMNFI